LTAISRTDRRRFLGSGSTLIAADKTGRVCRGVELDPLYVDVIVRRFEAATGNQAVLVETGETFEALARSARPKAAVPQALPVPDKPRPDESLERLLNP
jgi:hypothetical protein